MKYGNKLVILAASTALLSACGSFDGVDDNGGGVSPQSSSSLPTTARGEVPDTPVKLGAPYKIDGKTYTPADVADYDEVGYASFYGQELAGRPTANGEKFNPSGSTAAHKTLPLPSYVEVTALDTGKTILVRINDRGPFAKDRLIDLSEGAARQLGITQQGVAGVRVRKVNPPEQERSVLRSGRPAIERLSTPDSLLIVLRENLGKLPRPVAPISKPKAVAGTTTNPRASSASPSGRFVREGSGANNPPRRNVSAPPRAAAKRPATSAPTGQRSGRFVREGSTANSNTTAARASGYVVQLASFGSRSRADALAKKLGANVKASEDGRLFRVRYGPYASEAEAQRGLATARERGYSNARIFRR